MSEGTGTVVTVLGELAAVLKVLADSIDGDRAAVTLTTMGLDGPAIAADQTFRDARDDVIADVASLLDTTASLTDSLEPAELVALGTQMSDTVASVVAAVEDLGSVLDTIADEAPTPAELFSALLDVGLTRADPSGAISRRGVDVPRRALVA